MLPLLPIAGGVMSGLGLLGGLLGSHRRSPSDTLLSQEYSRIGKMQDPTYGFGQFERMAAAASGGLNDYLAQMASRGGSGMQAQAAFDGAKRQASGQAYEAFGQYRTNLDGQVMQGRQGLLGMMMQREQAQRDERSGFYNNLVELGGGLLQGLQRPSSADRYVQGLLGGVNGGRSGSSYSPAQPFTPSYHTPFRPLGANGFNH